MAFRLSIIALSNVSCPEPGEMRGKPIANNKTHENGQHKNKEKKRKSGGFVKTNLEPVEPELALTQQQAAERRPFYQQVLAARRPGPFD